MVWNGYGPLSNGKIGHELQSIILEPFLGASWQRCAIPFLTQRVHGLLLSQEIWDFLQTTHAWKTFFLFGFFVSGFFSSTLIFLFESSVVSSLLFGCFLSLLFEFFTVAFVVFVVVVALVVSVVILVVDVFSELSFELVLTSDTVSLLFLISAVCTEELELVVDDVTDVAGLSLQDFCPSPFFLLWIKLSNK